LAPNDDDGINKEVSQKKRQSRFRCWGDRINVVFLRLRLLSWRLGLRFSRGQDKNCKNKKIQLMKNSRTLAAEICHTFQLCQSCRGGDWWPNSNCVCFLISCMLLI
jgi:hypothetical protein